jgi:hypothetical protein
MLDSKFAFKFNAANCVVDTGLFASDILSAFDKPTIDLVIQLIMHHYQQN